MFKSSTFIFLTVLSVAKCQFYYNYEDEKPETQNYDPSAYQYNSPSSVNQQFVQTSSSDAQPSSETGGRRTRVRVRSRNHNSAPDDNSDPQPPESNPAPESNVDQRAVRQQRRHARRQQRQGDSIEQPRIYYPSVFEKIGLGEAPRGIYIPQNSFLNVLRNPTRRAESSLPVSPSVATVPQITNYVQQPSVSYVNTEPIQGLFIQPPTSKGPRHTNLILPITRSQTEYSLPSLRQPTSGNQQSGSQNIRSRAVGTNRQMRQKIRLQSEYAAPPTVDIDSFRESTDDVARENVMSQVQYVRPETRTQSRRRTVTNIQQTPRVYSPSIFEKVALGEAPNGIYVPKDSLLNVLRNLPAQQIAHRSSRQESQQLPPQKPSYNAPEEHVEEIGEEEHYPPPPRKRPNQRSRQATPFRRSENPGFQNKQQNQSSVQPVQSPSQYRNQRNDVYEDFEKQRPTPVQHRTQSHRRPSPISAAAPRSQTQTSDRGQTTSRKAKLAIAELPLDTDEDGIPGDAGVNYPTLHRIPKTAFSCSQQEHNGYYADLETSCQVVHLCQSGGVKNSFLCPNGTIFSQEKFSCQWWYKVNCSDAPKFYIKNEELYKVPEKKRN